ncbi:hypothetical protein [Nocardioides sp.]|uniref:hypothetical protein n=1 Tax=Nocardioides sp. TaxID=35761 RepID=UPI002C98A26B|nr:hypothetical protein [Nocardioides sp.]HXH78694.1 hypothetical protein [Nocardioides sp.]
MNSVMVNDVGVASQIELRDCIAEVHASNDSAMTQWVYDVMLISKLSTSLMRGEHDVTVGQMLVASMVSSTENYYRTLFADLVHTCPWTARNVGNEPISFAAVQTFGTGKAGFGLVEGKLFSSRGVIAKEIKRFTRYQVQTTSTLGKAIAAFDSVCAIRHAAVHWSGRFDTRAHESLSVDIHRRGQHGLNLDIKSIQDGLAACDFLVRTSNQVLFDHTLNRWLNEGYLGSDALERENRDRARSLSTIFAERRLKSSVTKKIIDTAAVE